MVRHGSLELPIFDITMVGIPPETIEQKWISLTAVNVLLRYPSTKEQREKNLQQQQQLLAEIVELEEKNKR